MTFRTSGRIQRVLKFVLLGSDYCHRKGGLRSSPLFQFLLTFYSDREVCTLQQQQLDPRRIISTEFLLIETPSSLSQEKLRGIRYQKAIVFDDSDSWWLNESEEQQEFLSSLTDFAVKSHVDRTCQYPFRMGTLPLYRKKKLQQCLKYKAWRDALFGKHNRKDTDLFFIGAPTRLQRVLDGPNQDYNQRLEWLSQVMTENFPYRFVGGLECSNQELIKQFGNDDGDLSPYLVSQRYNFYSYFRQLCRSKIALVPTGFSRWTYRHYEAAYAKSVMLSTDMSNIELFVPLPPHLINVPDHAPLLPYVEQGLKIYHDHPELLESNIQFLEQYYEQGRFSKRRPKALERFLDQLNPGFNACLTNAQRSPEQHQKTS
ncbi:hypothetical protein Pan54_08780 [Rubinisphaera italica]|uniref:Glycosyltransferase family 1 protein n=1 Tax=Rubinisphaera italica TaxID=2527969 RepID=A0A5C5XBM7_9PLAN|nr:hypothetical protein Pan54_08780 [Rubinisphaera italica]